MRDDAPNESRPQAASPPGSAHDHVEHERLEDAVREDPGERDQTAALPLADAEEEIGAPQHPPRVVEGAAPGPPLALEQRVQVLRLRLRETFDVDQFRQAGHEETLL